jgi:hypothetical protein
MATRTIAADELGLAEAIADTEKEIFDEGSGAKPLDNDGDRSLEEQGDDLEGRTTEEEPGEETETKPDDEGEKEAKAGDGEKPRDEKTGQFAPAADDKRMVPSGRLREETLKRTQAEQQLADRERRLDEIAKSQAEQARRLDELQARLTAPPQRAQQEQEQQPDPFGDPVGFGRQTVAAAVQTAEMRFVEGSLSDAAETHGDKFTAAYNELQNVGRAEMQRFGASPTVRSVWSAPNPGKALMRWHGERQAVREVGADPAAYREKILADALKDEAFLAKVVEAAGNSARRGDGGRPRTTTRLPPSLNSQTGSTHQVEDPDLYDPSDKSAFEYATR